MALMLFAAVVLLGAAGFVTGLNTHAAQDAESPARPNGMQVSLLRD